MVNAMHYLSGRYVTAAQLPTERRLTAVIVKAEPEVMELSHEEKKRADIAQPQRRVVEAEAGFERHERQDRGRSARQGNRQLGPVRPSKSGPRPRNSSPRR